MTVVSPEFIAEASQHLVSDDELAGTIASASLHLVEVEDPSSPLAKNIVAATMTLGVVAGSVIEAMPAAAATPSHTVITHEKLPAGGSIWGVAEHVKRPAHTSVDTEVHKILEDSHISRAAARHLLPETELEVPEERHVVKHDHSKTYTIQSGDTLNSIAVREGITLEHLLALNPSYRSHENEIFPDQKLVLPTQKHQKHYDFTKETVEAGDTYSALLEHVDTEPTEHNIELSAKKSHVKNANDIFPGQKLEVVVTHPHKLRELKQQAHEKAEQQRAAAQAKKHHHTETKSAATPKPAPEIVTPQPKPASVQPPNSHPKHSQHEQQPKDVHVLTTHYAHVILQGASHKTIKENLPLLLKALKEQGIDDPQMVAYSLATINAETSGFKPIPEYGSGAEYNYRADLGNIYPGDGERFKGRGFIQLTGRSNYRLMGQKIGVDLESHPGLALQPKTAAKIFAVFVAERKQHIREALDAGDLDLARTYVNGGTNGIDAFSQAYNRAIRILPINSNTPVISVSQLPPQPVSTPVAPTSPVIPAAPTTPAPVTSEAPIDPASPVTTTTPSPVSTQPAPVETAPAAPNPSPEDQAKQTCDDLDLAYSGVMQGYQNSVEHDIYTCQIPTEFTVGGSTHYINVDAAKPLVGFLHDAKAAGYNITIESAFRSMELSKELRVENGCTDVMTTSPEDCAHPTAIPGTSNHQMGDAVDLMLNGQYLSPAMSDYQAIVALAGHNGLYSHVANDTNHFSLTGN